MTPHIQRFRHAPAEGIYGDCFRTCIACLLDVEPEALPHEHREYENGEQLAMMNRFLAPRGLRLIYIGFPNELPLAEFLPQMAHVVGEGCRFLLGGVGARGVDHVVIADVQGIVHDPHPDGGGLDGPSNDPALGSYWALIVIGKIV